jgi:phytoene dehydrogenase-like protein
VLHRPLARARIPFLNSLPLARHGLELVHPAAPLAHPLDDGTAVMLERSLGATAAGLGPDERAYRRMFDPLVRDAEVLFGSLLAPLRPPRHPLALARFAAAGTRSAVALARSRFEGERARALLGGCCAHSMLPLQAPVSGAFGVVLAMSAHAVGWPVARGGSQRLADALAAHLESLGGRIETARPIAALDELPAGCSPVLLDVTPRQLIELAAARLPDHYRRRLARYRSRGPLPRRRARGRCTSRDRSKNSRQASRQSARAGIPSVRSCCSCRRAASTTHGRPGAGTARGPNATCPTAPRAT